MAKRTTDSLLSINVYNLHRAGLLVDGESGAGDILLGEDAYTQASMSFSDGVLSIGYYRVKVKKRDCHFGGISPIFVCSGCSRNSVVLYGGGGFRCRKCLNLAYPSQNEKALDRTIRRLRKLRQKYGWNGGICSPVVYRRKRQRFETFAGNQQRYIQEIETLSSDMQQEFSQYRLYK